MISDSQYDALLGNLYAGTGNPERMSAFMRGLGDLTGSHVTTFMREDFANPSASTFLTTGAEPEEIIRYAEFGGENIWMQRSLSRIQSGAVLNGDEHVSNRELVSSRYYNDFLRHMDIQHSVGVCASQQQHRAVFLTVGRSGRHGAYDENKMQLFRRIAPHIVSAVAMRVDLECLRAQTSQATIKQRGMFLLDSRWRWVGGNPVAEQMVAAGWWRGRLKSRLDPTHLLTRTAWQSLQRKLHGDATHQVIAVHDRSGMLVAFASVHAHAAAAVGEHTPRYVVFVRPLHTSDSESLSIQLIQLFGLTAAEAGMAVALRKHGNTAHSAASLGITEASARTRLQVVFEKTGMHRQADLLLMIEALAETAG